MTLLPTFFVLMLVLSAAILVLATMPSREEREIQVRIADIRNPRRALNREAGEADGEADFGKEAATLSRRLGKYLRQYSFSATIERLILQADSPTTVGAFFLKSIEFGVGLGLGALLLTRSLPLGSLLGLLGLVYPGIGLRMRRARRLKAVTLALPDAADLMARALRAGHSMTQAIEVMAERAPQPLADEFARVFQQQKLGVALRDVLVELGERIPLKDLHFLVTAILVQRDTGGDLAEILERTTRVLRERIRVQGEVQVQTAQGRLTGWILSLLPVGLLGVISLFSPGYSNILFVDPLGRMLLYAAGASIAVGALVIRRIVRVSF